MTKDQKNNLINFGLRLKKARERAGLTQQELADKVGTSKSMISSYENATADPRQSFVPLLTNALGISILLYLILVVWEIPVKLKWMESYIL